MWRGVAMIMLWTNLALAAQPRTLTIEWSEGPRLPIPVGGHAACVADDRLIVAGGTTWADGKKRWLDELWQLDEAAGRWRLRGRLPVPLADVTADAVGSELVLIGGWNEAGVVASMTRIGATITTQPWADAVTLAGGGNVGGVMVVAGGARDPADFATASANCSAIRMDLQQKRPVAQLPRAIVLPASAVCGGSLYLFGGMGLGEDGEPTDRVNVYAWDVTRNEWTERAPLPAPRRGAAAVAIDDRRILIIGGGRNVDGKPVILAETLLYDTVADQFERCDDAPYAAAGLRALMHRGKLYLIGGEDQPRHRTDRVVIGRLTSAAAAR